MLLLCSAVMEMVPRTHSINRCGVDLNYNKELDFKNPNLRTLLPIANIISDAVSPCVSLCVVSPPFVHSWLLRLISDNLSIGLEFI